MFDYGLDPIGVMNNISLLGLDVGKSQAFTLSHGHFDHYMAAVEILKRNQADQPDDFRGTPYSTSKGRAGGPSGCAHAGIVNTSG